MLELNTDNTDEVMSEINMTPLVDVMLVLLIIFMIAMPLLTQSIRIDLPVADSQPDPVKPSSISLSVAKDGNVHWDKEPINEIELKQRLQNIAKQQPQPEIRLHGDKQAAYGQVVRVMSAVRSAGIQQLGFVTLPE